MPSSACKKRMYMVCKETATTEIYTPLPTRRSADLTGRCPASGSRGCPTGRTPPPPSARRRSAPRGRGRPGRRRGRRSAARPLRGALLDERRRSEEHTSELQSRQYLVCRLLLVKNECIWFVRKRRPPRSTLLSLHVALPISQAGARRPEVGDARRDGHPRPRQRDDAARRADEVGQGVDGAGGQRPDHCGVRFSTNAADRKSTRLNSSHANISYAVFCL